MGPSLDPVKEVGMRNRLQPGDVIKCFDEKDWQSTAKFLKEKGYQVTMQCLVSEKDGDKYWIEIADPDHALPFPERGAIYEQSKDM